MHIRLTNLNYGFYGQNHYKGLKITKNCQKTRFILFSNIFYIGNARNSVFKLTNIVTVKMFSRFLVFWHP